MAIVTVNGKKKKYGSNTTLETVAADFQADYAGKIVLAKKNGVLRELFRTVGDGGEISFITLSDPVGNATYERSVIFLAVKAFADVDPKRAKDFYVDFSISNGIFCRLHNGKISKAKVTALKKRMKELAAEELPFEKEAVSTRLAIDLFEKNGWTEKAKLFSYRRASESKIYRLGETMDYYFAYLVPNTGYLTEFDVIPYEDGLVLRIPQVGTEKMSGGFVERKKLFETMRRSSDWCEAWQLNTVGDLNERIVKNGATNLILYQEAVMEKEIGDIAKQIADSGKKIVMIAGPSSSGKTTFSNRLSIQLMALGLTPHPIACDDYFKNRADYPVDENGNVDFEAIECVDRELLSAQLAALLTGEEVSLPSYNFTTGEREYRGKKLRLGAEDLVILEGIHCLNDQLTESLPADKKFRIYISALTQLNVDEHNRIKTTDTRLLRRIIRDARTRNYSAADTIGRWGSVRRGEEKNIFPYQENCDYMFNSALIYELSVMKPYVEPLLFSVPKDAPEYVEAKRLLKFLDYFLAIPSEEVPKNSLVREFIGGGIFDV